MPSGPPARKTLPPGGPILPKRVSERNDAPGSSPAAPAGSSPGRPRACEVVAFSPHPDDVEMWAGGTLARLAASGYRVAIVDLTAGEAATRGTPEIRFAEAQAAAKDLGAVWRETLDLGDSRLAADHRSKIRVAEVVRALRPRLALTTWFEASHPDHAAAARLVVEGAYLAGLRSFPAAGEPHRPARVLHYELPHGLRPSFFVDIGDFREMKERAIRRHASQLHDPGSEEPETPTSRSGLLAAIRANDARNGALIGCAAAEAFRLREAIAVEDPVAFLGSREFTRLI